MKREQRSHLILGVVLAVGTVLIGMTAAASPDFRFPQLVPTPVPFEAAEASSAVEYRKINVNTATVTELESLPGIGPVMAQSIVDYRTENGSFRNRKDLMKVRGIGEKTYEKLKDQITLG